MRHGAPPGQARRWSILALAVQGTLVCGAAADASDPPTTQLRDYYRYCIVGAGPGGLQLGQYMARASMDYVILEKARTPGSFYESYPRHRKLISINKRFTGRADPMFNMRHDWNSLLDTDVLEMTNRTEERFPHADVLVDYLRDFAAEQEDAGRIAYGTAVTQITRDREHRFKLHVEVAHNGEKSTLQCGCTIIAQGLHSPNVPAGWDEIAPDGRPLVKGYEDLPADGRQYENRAVAVFGMGNAGFETADAIAPYAQFVHVYPGSVRKALPIVAWETRYVGNLRAVNAQALDSYLLKSLDGGFANYGPNGRTSEVRACGPGRRKRCILLTDEAVLADGSAIRVLQLPAFDITQEDDVAFVQTLGQPVYVKSPVFAGQGRLDYPDLPLCAGAQDKRFLCTQKQTGEVPSFAVNNSVGIVVYLKPDAVDDSNIDEFVKFTARQGGSFPLIYDDVIRCLGWGQDKSIFSKDTMPIMQQNGKFAVMTNEYESVNVPGMYFAGVLGHGKDYRRSAGGFIHGFRYTARALFRILSAKYEAKQLAVETFNGNLNQEDIARLEDKLFYRIDNSDANYQMVHSLGDGVVLRCEESGLMIDYHEEVQIGNFHDKFADSPRMVWSFGFGQQTRSLSESITSGTLFEIFLWYYGGGNSAEPHTAVSGSGNVLYRPKELFSMRETFHTVWDGAGNRKNLRAFLKSKLSVLQEWCPPPGLSRKAKAKAKQAAQRALTSLVDLNQPPVKVSNKATDPWYPGQVNIFIQNSLDETIELKCDRHIEDVCKILEERKIAPHTGVTVTSFDTDVFQAIVDGETVDAFRVDVSRGIVQDWVIGFRPKHTAVHVIAGPAGEVTTNHLVVHGQSANCSKRCRPGQRHTRQALPSHGQPLEAWDVLAVSEWIVSELGLPGVAAAVTQHAVDGATAAVMLREDWREVGASGLESAKLISAVKKLAATDATASSSANEIIAETQEEIKLRVNGRDFVVDKESWLAFRVLEDGELEEAGSWDPARRQMDLSDEGD